MAKHPTMQMSFVARNAATRGPRTAATWRNSQRELSRDLSHISTYWNTYFSPLLPTLPDGTGTVDWKIDDFGNDLNAFVEGLDGSQLFIDFDTTAAEESGLFWNAAKNRPYTIKEMTKALDDAIETAKSELQAEINDVSFGLTASQKTLIGDRIFGNPPSSADSLDKRIDANTLLVKYLCRDIYDDINHSLTTGLTNSVKDIADALVLLHGGTGWQGALALSHSAIDISTLSGTLPQLKVDITTTQNDNVTVWPPTTLESELDYLRTQIRLLKGYAVTHWKDTLTTNATPLNAGAGGFASGLNDILANVYGRAATRTANNPWALRLDDIGAGEVLTYTGMTAYNDDHPVYSNHFAVTDGDSLVTAIGKLDSAIDSGIQPAELDDIVSFTGMSSYTDPNPTYSSAIFITQGHSLEAAIGELDDALDYILSSGVMAYTGMTTYYDGSPSYSTYSSTQVFATDGESLTEAAAKLDIGISDHYKKPYTGAYDYAWDQDIFFPSTDLTAHHTTAILKPYNPAGMPAIRSAAFTTDLNNVYEDHYNQPYRRLQDNLDWMCDPTNSGITDQNTFRRQTAITDIDINNGNTWTYTHNRGAYPMVQFFHDTGLGILLDGLGNNVVPFQVDENTAGIYNNSGSTIPAHSGIMVLLW